MQLHNCASQNFATWSQPVRRELRLCRRSDVNKQGRSNTQHRKEGTWQAALSSLLVWRISMGGLTELLASSPVLAIFVTHLVAMAARFSISLWLHSLCARLRWVGRWLVSEQDAKEDAAVDPPEGCQGQQWLWAHLEASLLVHAHHLTPGARPCTMKFAITTQSTLVHAHHFTPAARPCTMEFPSTTRVSSRCVSKRYRVLQCPASRLTRLEADNVAALLALGYVLQSCQSPSNSVWWKKSSSTYFDRSTGILTNMHLSPFGLSSPAGLSGQLACS